MKYRNLLNELIHDKTLIRRLYAVTLASVLFLLVLAVKGPEQKGQLITGGSGEVTAIRRNSVENSEQYDLTLVVGDQENAEIRDVTLTMHAVKEETSGVRSADPDTLRKAEVDAEVNNMVTEIEFSDDEKVKLPTELADGTRVRWIARKQKDRTGLIAVPLIYIFLAAAVIKASVDDRGGDEKKAYREIMKGLPRFCNQLLLMMNSGMILSDAFERICQSYLEYSEDGMSVFERELTELYKSNTDHRISTAAMLSSYASRHNVKELIRIATILNENEKRGSDVIESLSRESTYLWDDRKIVARECGRMIDTRMSWPLALLLILLIVITMAPAMLSM